MTQAPSGRRRPPCPVPSRDTAPGAGPSRATAPGAARRLALAGLAAGLAVVSAAACGNILPPRDLKAPAVSVAGVALDSISSERARFTLRLATRNPNTVDIPLSNVRLDFALLGQPLLSGAPVEESFTLPAGGEREVPVSFSVATADLRALLGRLLSASTSESTWELKGTAQWGSWPLPIPFSRKGDLRSLGRLGELLRL